MGQGSVSATHLLKGDGGQPGRDRIRTTKRGGGSPIILPMVTTGNREEAEFVSSRRDCSKGERGK